MEGERKWGEEGRGIERERGREGEREREIRLCHKMAAGQYIDPCEVGWVSDRESGEIVPAKMDLGDSWSTAKQ